MGFNMGIFLLNAIMKTTIDISEELLLAAKQEALNRGTSLKQILELALTQLLKPQRSKYVSIKTIVYPPPGTQAQPFPSNQAMWAEVYPLPKAFAAIAKPNVSNKKPTSKRLKP